MTFTEINKMSGEELIDLFEHIDEGEAEDNPFDFAEPEPFKPGVRFIDSHSGSMFRDDSGEALGIATLFEDVR